MPDISKINALAIGSVAKVDGLAKASILDIDGVAVPGAYLLDTYANAEAAFSVRRLNSQYTGACMRVRRASDNVEADIAFDAGELKLTSGVSNTSDAQSYTDFADFVGHGGTPTDGFVRLWYDQSQSGGTGSGNDAGNASSARQPKIYDATTGLIEEGSVGNEKPALSFDSDHFIFDHTFATNIYYSFFAVRQLASGTASQIFYGAYIDANWLAEVGQNNSAYTLQGGFNGSSPNDPTNTDYLLYRKDGAAAFSSLTTRAQYQSTMMDGNQHLVAFLTDGSPSSTSATQIGIGAYAGGSSNFISGTVQEVIMFNSTTSNESSNASGIETDINGYFNIYP